MGEANITGDLELAFEDLEAALGTTRFISGFLVSYDCYSDALRVEHVPTRAHIERAMEVYETNLEIDLLRHINDLTPFGFEALVVEILSGVDWAKNVLVTQRSRDGGFDFIGDYILPDTEKTMNLLGEVKHWKKPVGVTQIREFIGVLAGIRGRGPRIGIYISTNGFTESALREMERSPHRLHGYDAAKLIELMDKYNVGVQGINVRGKVIDEQFWKEIED
jgi:restriction endonuclease Mrr